ncbi:hypothetical protein [Paraburkholderia gardini]|uniref:hypothetical protein n=1 Tax=Paraburkholderia gardini TaxID=2823469 RepID=UPI001E6042CA|nr:hypothetical protein [Paraburkholderia gardini]
MVFLLLFSCFLSEKKEWWSGMCKKNPAGMRCGNRSVKYFLIALFTVLPSSMASTFSGTPMERRIDVAMVTVDPDSPHMANHVAPWKADLARITYTPARSNNGPVISPALRNNENYNGGWRARLHGDRFEWQLHGNTK